MSEPISKASSSFTDDIPFQALIENITDAVIFADIKGNVIYANHQARSICGLDKNDRSNAHRKATCCGYTFACSDK